MIYLYKPSSIEQYIEIIRTELKGAIKIDPWFKVNHFVANAISSNRMVGHISEVMVFLAVLFPVFALFTIHVSNEKRQIVTLAAMGISRWDIFYLFLLRAFIVGLLGSIIGVVLGYLLCRYFMFHPIYASQGFVVKPKLDCATIAWPVIMVWGTTLLGGLIPALRATMSNPSEAMKEDL